MSTAGSLIVISAPSGAGKTSLVKALVKQLDGVQISVSHTTRSKRVGEENGVDYHFVTKDVFEDMLKKEIFFEHAEVFGNYYGTSEEWVRNTLQSGVDVILEIDWQGARQVCKKMSNIVTVFILPPSEEILRQRLEDRDQDEAHVIAQRMQKAKREVAHYNEYDYLIVNADFDAALNDLNLIVKSSRLQTIRQKLNLQEIISQMGV